MQNSIRQFRFCPLAEFATTFAGVDGSPLNHTELLQICNCMHPESVWLQWMIEGKAKDQALGLICHTGSRTRKCAGVNCAC